ncbi:uncharacterized protein [Lolium perenne]|uniref:uncharacterized protein isoform X1 n=1 Tax=Lolium perenne TaxID=4522 RepID=UPI003A99A48A
MEQQLPGRCAWSPAAGGRGGAWAVAVLHLAMPSAIGLTSMADGAQLEVVRPGKTRARGRQREGAEERGLPFLPLLPPSCLVLLLLSLMPPSLPLRASPPPLHGCLSSSSWRSTGSFSSYLPCAPILAATSCTSPPPHRVCLSSNSRSSAQRNCMNADRHMSHFIYAYKVLDKIPDCEEMIAWTVLESGGRRYRNHEKMQF